MKIAICDDRKDDRDILRELLEGYGKDFKISEYASGNDLCGDMEYIRDCRIVFLAINMEDMDELEAAGRIKAEYPQVHIVLVSACMNYALDGYKVKASRFLLKDDLEQTLGECMDDILKEIQKQSLPLWKGKFGLRWMTLFILKHAGTKIYFIPEKEHSAFTGKWTSWKKI